MSGLGITFLRRGNFAPLVSKELSVADYIKDSALLILDGKEKGNVDGQWSSLIDESHTFVNYGAIAEADGWRFDGSSSYMQSTATPAYSWYSSGYRTLEIVVEFERGGLTEVVMMGKTKGISFGRYVDESCIILSETSTPVNGIADNMAAGLLTLGIVFNGKSSNISYVNGIKNGVAISAPDVLKKNAFGSATSAVLLGKRSTGNHFKGKIYAIRIHNRALTNEELLYNYEIDKERFRL